MSACNACTTGFPSHKGATQPCRTIVYTALSLLETGGKGKEEASLDSLPEDLLHLVFQAAELHTAAGAHRATLFLHGLCMCLCSGQDQAIIQQQPGACKAGWPCPPFMAEGRTAGAGTKDRCRLSGVCKKWRRALSRPEYWQVRFYMGCPAKTCASKSPSTLEENGSCAVPVRYL